MSWYDTQIRDGLGVDIFQHPFDMEKGFTIISSGNIEILLYKLESLHKTFSVAMEQYLGIPALELKVVNKAERKSYSREYKKAMQDLDFSEELLNQVYSSRLVRYFYTNDEIHAFSRRWSGHPSP
jgi:hypothetical protein